MDRADGTFFLGLKSGFTIVILFPGIKIPGYNMDRSYGTAKLRYIEEP